MFINLGEFVDQAPFVSNYQFMKPYFRSIKEKKEDYLSIADYIWRWDPDLVLVF